VPHPHRDMKYASMMKNLIPLPYQCERRASLY
jgi:hypothetical protein